MGRLVLENISKIFASAAGDAPVTAVDRFSIEVSDGKLLVLLGPSGCGKTTLLRLIAGLEHPSVGRILMDGHPLEGVPPQKRSIGMAFQYPALLPQLTVRENIALGPKLRGASSDDVNARISELAELLRINDLLTRLPETLSGGQQQRVSLARALAIRPAVLLLDEPLANLDPASRSGLREAIRAAQQKLGVTTIYVTHDQTEAAAIADEIAIMNCGALQQVGTAPELYRDPKNLFVAEFFSPDRPNVFTGGMRDGRFHPNGATGDLPARGTNNGNVKCVLRPSAIRPGRQFQARIQQVQHTGWSTKMTIDFGGLLLRAEIPFSPALQAGQDFSFEVDPAELLFFENDSGSRLRV
jgi:ABC-type sugar transport system ATPase subunit